MQKSQVAQKLDKSEEDEKLYENCTKCGNRHTGSCSTDSIFFYWHPINPTSKPPQSVEIVGSWHQWQTHQRLIRQLDTKGETYFQLALNLPVGVYEYKYLIDGRWEHDPHAPCVQDPFGSLNNVIEVFPKKAFMEYTTKQDIKITSGLNLDNLKIVGSWDNWACEKPMRKQYNSLKGCQQNVIYLRLVPNTAYEFKFKLGKQFLIDDKYPTVSNKLGSLNNIIITYSDRIDTPSGWRINKTVSYKEISCKYFEWEKIMVQGDLPYEWVEGHTMCNIGQYIYIFGGKSRNDFTNSLTKMSVHNYNNISAQQQLPNPRAFHSMVTYGNKIIIYGGHNQSILQDYHSFNVIDLTWSGPACIAGPTPQKRQKQSCVISEMLLVFFGGYYCSPDFQYETIFNQILVLNIQNMQWIQNINIKGQKPLGRFAHTASIVQLHIMYVFGGCSIEKTGQIVNFNDCWKLNLQNVNSLKWQRLQPKGTKPPARHGHSMNVMNNFLIIFGGNGENSRLLNDLVVLDTKNNEWIYPIVKGDVPRPRYNHASTTVQGEYMMVLGGKTKDQRRSQHVYVLKPKEYKPSLDIQEQQI